MKIDYEITVDVSNESEETKKKVQDAFFKLGFKWSSGGIKHLDKSVYTNERNGLEVVDNLMYSIRDKKPTHTIEELFKLAGMENEMEAKPNLKPFDLEKALKGEQVVTRDGRPVTQIVLFDCEDMFSVMTVIDGHIKGFTKRGSFFNDEKISNNDLFMKPNTEIVNGFEINE